MQIFAAFDNSYDVSSGQKPPKFCKNWRTFGKVRPNLGGGGGQAQKFLSNNFVISAYYKLAPKTTFGANLKFSIFPPGRAQVPDDACWKFQDGGNISFTFNDRAK